IKVPTLLFGTIPWPHLPLPDSLGEASEEAHELLAWLGLVLIALHVAGALRHHFLLNDGLLQRMAPHRSLAALSGLVALGIAIAGATLMLAGGSHPESTPVAGPDFGEMEVEKGAPASSEQAAEPAAQAAADNAE